MDAPPSSTPATNKEDNINRAQKSTHVVMVDLNTDSSSTNADLEYPSFFKDDTTHATLNCDTRCNNRLRVAGTWVTGAMKPPLVQKSGLCMASINPNT
mmetsp:Transcript_3774/g.4368  ORF Transcript_3774/g.4368 Transcript_3774/m.4368 type:complete len:98 (-) Transcript_3774:165-458(-)